MNIVVLSPLAPYPPIGGWALAIYQDLVGLAGCGHRLHLCAVTNSPNENAAPLAPYCTSDYLFRKKPNRFYRVARNIVEPYPFIISHFDVQELADRVAQYIDAHPTDIILAQDIAMSPVAYQVRKRTRTPVYLRLHNVTTQIFDRFGDEQKNPLLRKVARWQANKAISFERDAINAADGVSSVSASDDDALVELLPGLHKPRDVIGFGANLDALPCQLEHRQSNVIMHLGSLMQYTKLEGMQWFCHEVLPQVRASHPDVVVQLAGHTPEQAFADDGGVERLGVVDDPLPCLHRGRLFIAPQFVGSGMRLKLLNAMATGNAVVCTTVACEGIPIQDGVHGLIRDEPIGFADAVRQLLDDDAFAQRLGRAARELVERHFDYRRVAQQLSDCMTRVVRGEPETHRSADA